MIEQWVPIVGFEGKYSVSNTGKIRNDSSLRILRHRIGRGYEYVTLHIGRKNNINKIKKSFIVHRLVAKAFLKEELNKQVNHKDGNKRNNCSDNLEWVTSRENVLHAKRLGLSPIGENMPMAKLSNEDVNFIRNIRKNSTGKQRSSSYITLKDISKKFNVSRILIGLIVREKAWKHLLVGVN